MKPPPKTKHLFFKVLAGLLIACIVAMLVDAWLSDNSTAVYIGNRLTHEMSSQTNIPWSHISIYAASNMHSNESLDVSTDNISTDGINTCSLARLNLAEEPPADVRCVRTPPRQDSCQIADSVFHSEPTPTCEQKKPDTFCTIVKQSTEGRYVVNCSASSCTQPISFGVIDSSKGVLSWRKMDTMSMVEVAISSLLEKNESNGNYGFCFLMCQTNNNYTAKQLLLVPKNIYKHKCKEGTCDDHVNVNIIWLDSTAHSHFFRSMPNTVETLRRIREEESAHVFSFNLMQAMRGGTFVNTVAFTAGEIQSRSSLLKKHVSIGNLLYLYRKAGYHVTWIDDLCWSWSVKNCACGIPKFMGLWVDKKSEYGKIWKKLQSTLPTKGIDDIDISLANCEIYRASNIAEPFKSKSASICYNGLYQTDYIMSSLELLQTQLNAANRPHFNYLDLNLGHESSGRRIQTLDRSLAKFMTFLSKQNNTITFMFGDHGNKYGTFVKKSQEARIEMSHTLLSVIVSDNLKTKLGHKKMQALAVNQNRLVNILDIRHAVLDLLPLAVNATNLPKINPKLDSLPGGLFTEVSPMRSCESMGIMPEAGKCICQQGKEQNLTNSTNVIVLASFALGEINNKVQEQFAKAHPNKQSGFGACHRHIGTRISNVQGAVVRDLQIVEMDIYVSAGKDAPQSEDGYSVVLHVSTNRTSGSSYIKLVHYERITTYGVYTHCRDTGVNGDLCVCSNTSKSRIAPTWHLDPPVVFGQMTTAVSLNSNLYFYERRTPYGIVLETSCDANQLKYEVIITIVAEINVVSSHAYPLKLIVSSGMFLFVDVFYQLDQTKRWKLEYDIQFRQI